MLVQHLASLTRKTWPSVASNCQAMFCSQGIKRPARMSPAFDGLYFLRMCPSYLLWYLMDCKIGVILLSLYYPCAFLEFLEPIIAIGDSQCAWSAHREFNPQKRPWGLSLSAVQHLASSTRKTAIGLSLSACSALSEFNPQNMAFGCKQLSGHVLLSRYQKTGVHAAGFWWIVLFEDVSKLSALIFDGL